jgi:dTMP kinase
VCDRYYDSTRAYQIAAGGLDPHVLTVLNQLIEAPSPDLTLILDVDPSAGLSRGQGAHAGEDRFERKGANYHARVRTAFHEIARAEPERCVLINAAQTPEAVLNAALSAAKKWL